MPSWQQLLKEIFELPNIAGNTEHLAIRQYDKHWELWLGCRQGKHQLACCRTPTKTSEKRARSLPRHSPSSGQMKPELMNLAMIAKRCSLRPAPPAFQSTSCGIPAAVSLLHAPACPYRPKSQDLLYSISSLGEQGPSTAGGRVLVFAGRILSS